MKDEDHFFSADTPDQSKYAVRSVFGEKWKRHLRGNWYGDKGSLWWGSGVQDQSFDANITDWDDLARSYYEVFERLKNESILRNSFLIKDGDIQHQWSHN